MAVDDGAPPERSRNAAHRGVQSRPPKVQRKLFSELCDPGSGAQRANLGNGCVERRDVLLLRRTVMATLHREESRNVRAEWPDHCKGRSGVPAEARSTCTAKHRRHDSGHGHGCHPRRRVSLTLQIPAFVIKPVEYTVTSRTSLRRPHSPHCAPPACGSNRQPGSAPPPAQAQRSS